MSEKKILILDYSVDRIEAAAIKRWLPAEAQVTTLFIDTEESFPDDLIKHRYTHVVHSGSSLSITEPSPFTQKAIIYIQKIRDQGVAQFGICYGHQLVCLALVGKHAVRSTPKGLEVGWREVTFTKKGMEHLGLREREIVWQYHYDEVTELPQGSEILATNPHSEIQAYINADQKLLGTQFHPEFDQEVGNRLYLDDREYLEKSNYDVDEMINGGPSFHTGKVLFNLFLGDYDSHF